MADTIRTTAYILASLIQDGQAPLSISEQDHRDIVVSLISRMSPPFEALTDGATITWATAGNPISHGKVTLGGNRTLAITGAVDGSSGLLRLTQDGTGSRTLTLPSGSKAAGGAFTLSTPAGSVDLLGWVYDGTSYFWTIGKAFA
jgi:hypothetical protein